jgi:rRNA maturation RNase YbeY
MIEVHYDDMQEVPDLNPELLVFWLLDVIRSEGFECGPINLIFCSDDCLLRINKQFLAHDYYTDIVTFDYSEGGVLVGDLFVSVDRIRENALQYNQEVLTEMRRVCAHGVLHLCRYGDKTPEESGVMRSKEEFYLKRYVSRET